MLLVISELSRALREEERQAWQRIVRVIGHELNSSLAPIKSMAGTVRKLVGREPLPTDWRDDARAGLAIIHDRAESLERLHGRLRAARALAAADARAAPSSRRSCVASRRCTRRASRSRPARRSTSSIDPDQIRAGVHQLDAQRRRGLGRAGRRARSMAQRRRRRRRRRGRGRRARYSRARTTSGCRSSRRSRTGTGIGLVLSREIVENHGGSISLENRVGAKGASRACGCRFRVATNSLMSVRG